MKKPKLIFFDMEGTIFKKAVRLNETVVAPSAWVAIAKELGDEALAEEKKTQEKKQLGEYANYIEWMMESIAIHRKYNLTAEIFFRVIDSVEYMPGVHDVFEQIKHKKIPVCLISGGFKNQADKAIQQLKIDHAFVACEYFFNKDGLLEHFNLLPGDEKGKVDFLRLMMREYGVSSHDCAFVGDGMNDVGIATEVGVAIAFNANEELKKVATYKIDQEDGKENFIDVLNFLNL